MDYISVEQAAENWGVSVRRIQQMCVAGQIEGAMRFSRVWMIPKIAEKPIDGRRKVCSDKDKGGGIDE